MKNWKYWIPFYGLLNQPKQSTGWEWINWIWQGFWVLWLISHIISTACKAQSFTLVETYPFVITDIAFQGENMYACKQNGVVYLNEDTLLTIPVWNQNEMGLVGIHVEDNYLYLHASGLDSFQRVIRYDMETEVFDTLIEVDYSGPPFNTNHRGGDIRIQGQNVFASFGYGASIGTSQDLLDLRGKIVAYRPPNVVQIVAYGCRNPFRFDILNGDMFIADVGADLFEEVNYFSFPNDTLINFGFPCQEGDTMFMDTCGEIAWPVYFYAQNGPQSIIGGCYWNDRYYFTDHYTGSGGSIGPFGDFQPFPTQFPGFVTGMAVGPENKLYVSTWGGQIYRYNEQPLALEEDNVVYKRLRMMKESTVYVDILGRKWSYPPLDIIFYDPHIQKLRYIQSN